MHPHNDNWRKKYSHHKVFLALNLQVLLGLALDLGFAKLSGLRFGFKV